MNYLLQNKEYVYIKKCEIYDLELIENIIREGISKIGGLNNILTGIDNNLSEKNILIKPNLLFGKAPEKCVTTHPTIVEAVIKILKDYNCKISIGDSPGLGSAISAAEKSGYSYIKDKYGVNFLNFDNPLPISQLRNLTDNFQFKNVPVTKLINEYDYIINIAKFKTHGQMGVTLTIKNLFGCVVGHRKLQMHLGAGTNVQEFARMLLELHYSIKPSLNILDGIFAMEGNGPGSGNPKKLGVILIGKDALSIDYIACNLVNINQKKIPIFQSAETLGLSLPQDNELIIGDNINDLSITDFKQAIPSALQAVVMPEYLSKLFKNALTVRPNIIHKNCTRCGLCVRTCPAKAMKFIEKKNNKKVKIDLQKCIRCFCCQELCPEGTILLKRGFLNWLVGS